MALDIDPRDMFFPTNEKDDLFSNADKKENEDVAENEPAYPVHENGLVSENQQQMIQTSTFCPHCGKKVRVGVVLLDN